MSHRFSPSPRRRRAVGRLVLAGLCLLGLPGCQSSFGPRAIKQSHPAYNEAIVNTLDQQMLLNLVRLRYRDNPYFLEVSSVTATLSLGASAGVEGEIPEGTATDLFMPRVGVSYGESPTISYAPLRGEAFLRSVLSPLPLEALLVMTESGWSLERLFGLCLERINDLNNAPTASGPTPATPPRYERFARALELMGRLQDAGELRMGADPDSNNLLLQFVPDGGLTAEARELRALLGLSPDAGLVPLSSNFLAARGETLNVRVRSIASLLYYLSQHTAIPAQHEAAGLVTRTRTADGTPFDWGQTPAGRRFHILSSERQPQNAYTAVPYRGHWFYLADDDLESKSTFLLLQNLFSLQAGQTESTGPTLTLPVGGR